MKTKIVRSFLKNPRLAMAIPALVAGTFTLVIIWVAVEHGRDFKVSAGSFGLSVYTPCSPTPAKSK